MTENMESLRKQIKKSARIELHETWSDSDFNIVDQKTKNNHVYLNIFHGILHYLGSYTIDQNNQPTTMLHLSCISSPYNRRMTNWDTIEVTL